MVIYIVTVLTWCDQLSAPNVILNFEVKVYKTTINKDGLQQ